jgi:radical SAM protein with 4Fe4S-binding SPASM domain
MDCAQTTLLSNKEYLQNFNKKVFRQRIPLSGSIDLTNRCNLRCIHCYLGDKQAVPWTLNQEIDTGKFISVIDEITEAGCLNLLITGGEPLSRRDFPEIYTHAKKNGLIITLFTNGTLITESILKLFEELPPHNIEISLYGATAATYEKITGVPGSFRQCIDGIERLKDARINLKLKTMLMRTNSHEFYDIRDIAKKFDLKFRSDAALFPCFNGNRDPVGLRIPPQEAIEKEFSDKERFSDWVEYFERMKGAPVSDRLYTCGAGNTSFHIDPYGILKPCVMVRGYNFDLAEGSFSAGWHDIIPKIREKKAGSLFAACAQCEKKALCDYCPAFFELENGKADKYSEYLCAIGHRRFEAIKAAHLSGGISEVSV